MSLEKQLANDPQLLTVTRRHPPPLRRTLVYGRNGALIGGGIAMITGTPIENGLMTGAAAGLIIADLPDTARALRVDLHLLNRFVHEAPKRLIETIK